MSGERQNLKPRMSASKVPSAQEIPQQPHARPTLTGNGARAARRIHTPYTEGSTPSPGILVHAASTQDGPEAVGDEGLRPEKQGFRVAVLVSR